MKKAYRIYQVDSFTREKFTGNPAGVVIDADGLSDGQMLKIKPESSITRKQRLYYRMKLPLVTFTSDFLPPLGRYLCADTPRLRPTMFLPLREIWTMPGLCSEPEREFSLWISLEMMMIIK